MFLFCKVNLLFLLITAFVQIDKTTLPFMSLAGILG